MFRWSKTIQFGERCLQTPLLYLPDSCLCPVTAFKNMVKHVKIEDNAPLFTLDNGKPVTYYLFQKTFRCILKELGYDSTLFSTHSFRRGFATLAFRNNVPADEIQILGDWRSDVYKKYVSLRISDKISILQSISHNFYV